MRGHWYEVGVIFGSQCSLADVQENDLHARSPHGADLMSNTTNAMFR